MFRDKSDAIITKLRRIQVDLIKEAYETNGIYLGATKNKIEYHNYLDEDPIIITVDGGGNQTIESTGIIDNSSTNVTNKKTNNTVAAGNFGKKGSTRAKVIQELGFSSKTPSKEECDAMMKTVTLPGYNRRLTVHKNLAEEVKNIFQELYNLGMELNKYVGGYCYRTINNPKYPNSKTLSMHSFGCAIDINYDLNPFSKNPPIKDDNVKRGIVRTDNNPIVQIFAKYGWGWGGRYNDYMHFSKANGG